MNHVGYFISGVCNQQRALWFWKRVMTYEYPWSCFLHAIKNWGKARILNQPLTHLSVWLSISLFKIPQSEELEGSAPVATSELFAILLSNTLSFKKEQVIYGELEILVGNDCFCPPNLCWNKLWPLCVILYTIFHLEETARIFPCIFATLVGWKRDWAEALVPPAAAATFPRVGKKGMGTFWRRFIINFGLGCCCFHAHYHLQSESIFFRWDYRTAASSSNKLLGDPACSIWYLYYLQWNSGFVYHF